MFATRSFKKGEEIERCPMLVAEEDRGDDLESGAEGYVFGWGDGRTALALGYGSLYNHRYDPNATNLIEYDQEKIWVADDMDSRWHFNNSGANEGHDHAMQASRCITSLRCGPTTQAWHAG